MRSDVAGSGRRPRGSAAVGTVPTVRTAARSVCVALAAATAALVAAGRSAVPTRADDPPGYRLVDAYPGLTFKRPVAAVQPPDGTPRMFVAEQAGRIWVVDHPAPADEAPSKRLFLDLSDDVSRASEEEGLLGIAFHPGFASNRRFFVYFSQSVGKLEQRRDVLAEFAASASDPDTAVAASRRDVLVFRPPSSIHHGGWTAFGPDGFLHLARGDGGPAYDPYDAAQRRDTLLGKILRIDVDRKDPGLEYAIPGDNPFVGVSGMRGEIWAYGLRNPWRGTFDSATGDLYVGDVGQARFEEVDRIVRGGDYGWSLKEGFEDVLPVRPPPAEPLVPPLAAYDRDAGQAVVCGPVVRGGGPASLTGDLLYGDYATGRIWALDDPAGTPSPRRILDTDEYIASFAEDRGGRVFVLTFRGRVLELLEGGGPTEEEPLAPTLSALGLFENLRKARPATGALRYGVTSELWSDGARKSRFLALPPGSAMDWDDADAFGLPVGAAAVKTFVRDGRRLETRVILRTEEGFEAASYRWRDDLSDADRVDAPITETIGSGVWKYPDPDGCRTCHVDAAGFVLGVRAQQLPKSTVARWVRQGALAGAPAEDTVVRLPGVRGPGTTDRRARGYLDANCASCHRPDAPVNSGLDLRATTPLAATGLLDEVPEHGDLGIADARNVAPGDPDRSVLLARLTTLGDDRMPRVGSRVVDLAAVRLLRRWIRRL